MHKVMLAAVALLGSAPALAQDARPPLSQDTAWHNRQVLAVVGLKAADGWQPLPGNLRWRRIAGDGSGKHPTAADTVRINYAGTLTDGTEFDSSWKRGEPAVFPLGRLIKAWQVAVPMAGVGDTIELAIPADMAYGPLGKGPIPGDATLFFKIELLGIEPAQ